MTNKTSVRLHQGVSDLNKLDRRREETRSPRLGYDTEREIVDRELRELERDIMADPGALESLFVRLRKPEPKPKQSQ